MKIFRKLGLAVLSAIACLGILLIALGFVLVGAAGETAMKMEGD